VQELSPFVLCTELFYVLYSSGINVRNGSKSEYVHGIANIQLWRESYTSSGRTSTSQYDEFSGDHKLLNVSQETNRFHFWNKKKLRTIVKILICGARSWVVACMVSYACIRVIYVCTLSGFVLCFTWLFVIHIKLKLG
jgi:hypothetical protein